MTSRGIIIGIIIFGIIAGAGYWLYQARFTAPEPTVINSFAECAGAGYAVMESYPRQCRTPDGRAFTEDIGNELEKQDLIRVTNPRPNTTIHSPLMIEGEARGSWFFEASFPIRLLDARGEEIAVAVAEAQGEWMTTDFVPFQAKLRFPPQTMERGTLVFEKDNPSGLPEHDDALQMPIVFDTNMAADAMTVKVFFGNSVFDPDVLDCTKVFEVERRIARTEAIGRAALEELLAGPTLAEEQAGYFTSINSGVSINSLVIADGIARVDFAPQLEAGVGGSCRVMAIRAQIIETLKQFSTVNNVVISINGRTEDILQP